MPQIEIAMGGEAMLGRLFNQQLRVVSPSHPWGNAKRIWNNSDLFVCNLENTITTSQTPVIKTFNYKLHPKLAGVLTAGGVDYVSLANNHILDFNVRGLDDTKKHLDDLGILHAGAGVLEEAKHPVLLEINNIRVALFSAANHYENWAATSSQAGIWYVDIQNRNWTHILREIRKYRSLQLLLSASSQY